MFRPSMVRDYDYYRRALEGHPLPLAFVDLDAFDQNARDIARRAQGRRIRTASKSLRSVALIKRVLAADPTYQGILCFSPDEAVSLSEQGLNDLVVAYPTSQARSIASVCKQLAQGKLITLMVDCTQHVEQANRIATQSHVVLPLCMDVDMSTRFPGLHFGVYRSPLASPDDALRLFEQIESCDHVRLDGLMGYEAQIAGVGDRLPGKPLKNALIRKLKCLSIPRVRKRRGAVVAALEKAGARLRFVNGGGTGSVETTIREPSITEVAVGSGLYCSHLFDYYSGFGHLPAAGFALEVTRRPKQHVYTCAGGGYIASGAAGPEKLPIPYLPKGVCLIKNEGAGEVQTPVLYRGEDLHLGSPVFFRHGKAGELCERFTHLLLVSDGRVVDRVTTYRGDGRCFF